MAVRQKKKKKRETSIHLQEREEGGLRKLQVRDIDKLKMFKTFFAFVFNTVMCLAKLLRRLFWESLRKKQTNNNKNHLEDNAAIVNTGS